MTRPSLCCSWFLALALVFVGLADLAEANPRRLAALQKRLETRSVSVKVEGGTFNDALAQVSKAVGMTIELAGDAKASGGEAIHLELERVPATAAIDFACRLASDHPLTWKIEDSDVLIHVAGGKGASADDGSMVKREHDLGRLLKGGTLTGRFRAIEVSDVIRAIVDSSPGKSKKGQDRRIKDVAVGNGKLIAKASPATHDEIAWVIDWLQGKGSSSGPTGAAGGRAAKGTEMKLKKSADFELDNVPAGMAIAEIRGFYRVNVFVDWRALAAAKVTPSTPISFTVTKADGPAVLDALAKSVSTEAAFTWRIDDAGIVHIHPGAAKVASDDQPMVLKIYRPRGSAVDNATKQGKLMAEVGENKWTRKGGKYLIYPFDGQVIIKAPESVHDLAAKAFGRGR